jgi:hypothetical protein
MHAGRGDAVDDAISSYQNQQQRMNSPYRARGLQIGSGTVVVVRAWLRSERWDEAMQLRPPPRRAYRRRTTGEHAEAAVA